MPSTDLGRRFKEIINKSNDMLSLRDHLSCDFTYASYRFHPNRGFWSRINLFEYDRQCEDALVVSLLEIEIDKIYVDGEESAVIACWHDGESDACDVMYGVWIAHFQTDGMVRRIEEYCDVRLFDRVFSSSTC